MSTPMPWSSIAQAVRSSVAEAKNREAEAIAKEAQEAQRFHAAVEKAYQTAVDSIPALVKAALDKRESRIKILHWSNSTQEGERIGEATAEKLTRYFRELRVTTNIDCGLEGNFGAGCDMTVDLQSLIDAAQSIP